MTSSRMTQYRWFIVFLVFIATTINYLDRQIIGLLKPILEKEFAWSETDFARIVMAFTAAYAVGLVVSGWFIDKVGSKIGYAVTIVVWSAAGMLHALARSAFGFGLARIGLGIGEAGNYPAAMKTVAEWFPKKERGLATGLFNAGTSIGVVVAVLLVPLILRNFGWPEVFWITGLLGFFWLIAWWIFYDLPARQHRMSESERLYILAGQDASEDKKEESVRWITLFAYPQTWILIVGKGLIDPIYWFFLFWLPSYFSAMFALDLKKPSWELMIIYLATTLGSIFGGYLSSRLIKKGWPTLKARKTALLIFACMELSVFMLQYATNVWVAVGLLSLAVAVHQAWATNVFTLGSDLFPKKAVSSAVGIGGMAGALGGILFPLLVGSLLDSYRAENNLSGGYNVLFMICSVTYLIAWLLINLLTKKVKPISGALQDTETVAVVN
nr:MFS transporter [uncultured Arsenicibacter sp.]